jgi:hypothetical protein
MLIPVKGIIISVIGLFKENNDSIFSYIKKTKNKEKATMAYRNLVIPVLRYTSRVLTTRNADKTEPAMYNRISILS